MPRKLSSARSRPRAVVECCVYVLLAAGAMQTWFLEGLVVPCRVTGGSMAETLLGVHREVVCADCGYPFLCGSDAGPVPPRAACPNCGYADNHLEPRPELRGDGTLIDRVSFAVRGPRRWEIVAFRRAGQADEVAVKRVVGLPGEMLQIRHGDVYADGRLQRKTLAEQRALALLVHDANYEPMLPPLPPSRWRAETIGAPGDCGAGVSPASKNCRRDARTTSTESRWSAAGGRFSHPATPENDGVDWLAYHHWRRLPVGQAFLPAQESAERQTGMSAPPRVPPRVPPRAPSNNTTVEYRESPVTDLCGYNPSQPRREEDVHPVSDLLLSLRLVETFGQGVLVLRASDGSAEFQTQLQFDVEPPRYAVLQHGRPIPGAAGRIPLSSGGQTVEVSLIDRQFLLAFDGTTVVAWPYSRPEPAPTPPASPLAIGVKGLGVVLGDVKIYRDVYYTHPIGPEARWGLAEPVRLADHEYFVLGDNSPVSEDSRSWPERGAVDAKLLVGKPLAVLYPAQDVEWGQWHFQVPNPGRMRYIR